MANYKYCSYIIKVSYNLSMYKVDESWKLYVKILFYLWRILCNLLLVSGIISTVFDIMKKEEKDVPLIAFNIMNIVIFCCSLIRINYFYIYEDQLSYIVKKMNTFFKYETETQIKERSMEKYLKFTKHLVYFWTVWVFFTVEFMALLPLFFIHKTGRVLPLPCWYPYDWKQSPWFELTYFMQAVTQYVVGYSYGNSDMFYICTMILTTGQFDLLGWNFKNVVSTILLQQGISREKVVKFSENLNVNIGDKHLGIDEDILNLISTFKFQDELKKTFGKYVKYHQILLAFCKDLQDFFAPILLLSIVLGVFFGTFIMYALVTSDSTSLTLSLLEYLVTTYLSIFSLTFFGQLLTTQSENLRDRLYDLPWYLCDEKFKKSFNIVQTNVSKPIIVTGGKLLDMNLETYLAIVKTSTSYFAFLRQVTEK